MPGPRRPDRRVRTERGAGIARSRERAGPSSGGRSARVRLCGPCSAADDRAAHPERTLMSNAARTTVWAITTIPGGPGRRPSPVTARRGRGAVATIPERSRPPVGGMASSGRTGRSQSIVAWFGFVPTPHPRIFVRSSTPCWTIRGTRWGIGSRFPNPSFSCTTGSAGQPSVWSFAPRSSNCTCSPGRVRGRLTPSGVGATS